MPRVTQLYEYHVKHAKMTEFAGYDMPLWYTTTTDEHLAVRNSCGIFDVSHMGRFEVGGKGATEFLEGMVPTKVRTQPVGRAFYTLFLNGRGGIIDDLIVVKTTESTYTVVVNAANSGTDMKHLVDRAPGGVEIAEVTDSTIMVAVQGPGASESLQPICSADLSQLKRFRSVPTEILGKRSLVSRTGYTGEDGFEIIVYGPTVQNPKDGLEIWERLAGASTPCGLGARDSLRLEAGLPLHGSDIDATTNPFEADLAWVISEGKGEYFGRAAIDTARESGPETIRRGLVLGKGIPRHGFNILDESDSRTGTVTSGTFSPVLRKGIALCRVRREASEVGSPVKVVIRDTIEGGNLAKTPFYDEQTYGWKRAAQH
ncbi:MAG: glycine cleavage system aminomethyltransferase GcvT [Thaumarchaeota archaeon]|nr:glycine cleavage system aminomethyltransferase GcvT [Nitrososphaerota archaeon]